MDVKRLLVGWCLLIGITTAQAQSSATLDQFRPSETTRDDFYLSRPIGAGHLKVGALVSVDYANDPLVYEATRGDSGTERFHIVSHQLNTTAVLSLGLWDHLVVFAGLPVTAWMKGDSATTLAGAGLAHADDAGIGDFFFGARLSKAFAHDHIALGVQATGTFPTAGDQRFRGDNSVSLHTKLLSEFRWYRGMRLVLNVGAIVRDNTSDPAANLHFSDNLTFGLGAAIPVWFDDADERTHLDLHAQAYGSTAFDDFFSRDGTPIEIIGGAKIFHATGLVFGAAAGGGVTRGFGSPDYRLIGMVGLSNVEAKKAVGDADRDGIDDDNDACPSAPEDRDGFEDTNGCPDLDNDRDEVPDDADRCPNVPEDKDGFADHDGCPDPDNDEDGVLDASDQCSTEAEDRDGFEDEDGCNDRDNDADTLLDSVDACPNEAGPLANRGCPEPDRDHDSVIDRSDNCPDEPGPPENQGCVAAQQVRIEGEQIQILDVIYFRTNRAEILPKSFALLENVASVLNSHPEIARVRVEGHTDSRGKAKRNQVLSQARAESVVRFLGEHGVHTGRLEAVGFGSTRPIVPDAKTAQDHARNRRVEFHIATSP